MPTYRIFLSLATIFSVGLIFLATYSITHAAGTNYYVHAGVGSDNNSGLSPDDAFGTFKYAMKQLEAGDTLNLRNGTYGEEGVGRMSHSTGFSDGTASAPITVRPYLNESPMITNSGLRMDGLKGWVFENLLFQNAGTVVLGELDFVSIIPEEKCLSYAENIIFLGNTFQHGGKVGFSIRCAKNIEIRDNIFDNLRSRVAGKDLSAIILNYDVDNLTITGNHFRDVGSDGIQFGLAMDGPNFRNIVISKNEFEIQHPYQYRDTNGNVVSEADRPFDMVGENAIDVKKGPGPILISENIIHGFRSTVEGQDASGANGIGVVIHMNSSGITLDKNIFYDNQDHVRVARGTVSDYEQPARNTIITNNLFKETTLPGVVNDNVNWKLSALSIATVSDVEVANNTFIQADNAQHSLLHLVDISNVSLHNNIFKNGIVTTQWELPANKQGEFDNVIASNNAWSNITGTINSSISSPNDVFSDALNIDYSTYTPLTNSPLINAGTDVGLTEDYYGNPIVGTPDIGAVEYQPATSDTSDQTDSTSDSNTNTNNSTSNSSNNTDTVGEEDNSDPETTNTSNDNTNIGNSTEDTLRAELLARIAELQQLIATLTAQLNAQKATNSYQFHNKLKVGDENLDVLNLQKKLNSLGFTVAPSGAGAPGNETTYYGPRTTAALKLFQCQYNIVCSGTPETTGFGNFGPMTRAKMNGV